MNAIEDFALQQQIEKNMKEDNELAEYIGMLGKKLNYSDYKRYRVLKTSYWYYKRDAQKQLDKMKVV